MDDPFGWLQGEKISAKKLQETLQKKKEIHTHLQKRFIVVLHARSN